MANTPVFTLGLGVGADASPGKLFEALRLQFEASRGQLRGAGGLPFRMEKIREELNDTRQVDQASSAEQAKARMAQIERLKLEAEQVRRLRQHYLALGRISLTAVPSHPVIETQAWRIPLPSVIPGRDVSGEVYDSQAFLSPEDWSAAIRATVRSKPKPQQDDPVDGRSFEHGRMPFEQSPSVIGASLALSAGSLAAAGALGVGAYKLGKRTTPGQRLNAANAGKKS